MDRIIGTFTNTTEYLPRLLDSVNKYYPDDEFILVLQNGTIGENMARLRENFVASGKRWWIFLDHDVEFLSSETINNAIQVAEQQGWALTGIHQTYNKEDREASYHEVREKADWSSVVDWIPGFFMLVDSHKIGYLVPDTDVKNCIDVAYCAAIRKDGFSIGMAPEIIYHTFKEREDFPTYWADREILKGRYGNSYIDCHTEGETMNKFRFHIPGLAYLATRKEHSPCAFTAKLLGLCEMLTNLGHEVYFYGGEGSEVAGTEMVSCISNEDRTRIYGEYDWHHELFRAGDPSDEAHQIFNANCVKEINARKQPGDFLLCQVGYYQQPIAEGAGDGLIIVEPGIGHAGIFAPYRIFESYTWMHYLYGMHHIEDGPWYDAVIPGYYDPADFPYQEEKGDYFLFLARIVKRKGIELAIQIAQATGKKLIIAGQGELNNEREQLHLDPLPDGVDWVGAVEPEERAKLMGGAIATLMPVHYIEPFGAVAVETQMCGTPIITTDWGAFPETVKHGVTGYRCRTWDDFMFAAKSCIAGEIKPADCRAWSMNYSMNRIQWMYQEHFSKLHDLWTKESGWYTEHPERTSLDWLRKT